MTHIVTEPCIGCKNTQCVTVCPVDCFREDSNVLWIDPDECIDCGACIPECPVGAIFEDHKVPEKWKQFIQINAEKSKGLPPITQAKPPLGKGKHANEYT